MVKNKKGFTLIEILLIIVIISILATVVLVSIFSSQTKAHDYSAFYSMRGTADISFACLESQLPNVRLSPFDSANGSICIYNPGSGYVDGSGYSDWPDISSNKWETNSGVSWPADGFYWCSVNSSGTVHPNGVSSYTDGVSGGSVSNGNFCYILKNGTKYIWCTQEACKKEGF